MHLQKKYYSLIYLLIYTLVSVLILYKFPNYFTPDAISYLSITEHIINGNFFDSINGYWSPLVSWLLVPLHFFIQDGILCFQILNFIIGLCTVIIINKILIHHKISNPLLFITTLSISTLIPTIALLNLTADMLFSTLLLFYYLQLVKKEKNSFWKFGIIGFFLYCSKAYGFYFFLSFTLFLLVNAFYQKDKKKIQFLLKTKTIFLVLSTLWILVLFSKYKAFYISTASNYNKNIITTNGNIQHPCDTMHLIAPIKEHLYTPWEEMTLYTKTQLHKRPINDHLNFDLIKKNIVSSFHLFNKTTRYGLYFFFFLFLLNLFRAKNILLNIGLPLSMLILFTAGYTLYFIEERYLIFPILLLLLINLILITRLHWSNKILTYFLYVVVVYSICRSALDNYIQTLKSEEINIYSLSKQLKDAETRNFATYEAFQLPNIAYINKWKNFGGIKGYKKDSIHLEKDLTKFAIDFLILPDTVQLPKNVLPIYEILHLLDLNRFTVYKRK